MDIHTNPVSSAVRGPQIELDPPRKNGDGGKTLTVTFQVNGRSFTVQSPAPKIPLEFISNDAAVTQSNASCARAEQLLAMVTREMLEDASDQKSKAAEDAFKEAQAAMEAQAKADSMTPAMNALSILSNLGSIIMAVIGIIAGMAATAISGPAGAALVAVSVFYLMQSLVEMGGDIAAAAGHDVGELSLGRGIAEAVTAAEMAANTPLGQRMKEDPAYLETWKTGISIATGFAVSLAAFATGAGAAKVIKELGKSASLLVRAVRQATQVATTIAESSLAAAKAGTDIAHATVSFQATQIRAEAENHTAHKSYSEGMMKYFGSRYDLYYQVMSRAVELIMKYLESSGQAIKQNDAATMAIQRNMAVSAKS